MKIDILSLFPKMFDGFLSESIISRAINTKKIDVEVHNFREYSKDKHKKVDDTPFGGGSGMVLMCQPIFDAVNSLKKKDTKVIMLSPQGKKYNQKIAYELKDEKHLIFICGHYEGFDERITNIVDMEISIGDYVLTGGELPTMVVIDSIARLVPGVIDIQSHENESFNNNLLDYPTYTKPREYKGMIVPEVLVSGDHKKINDWRNEMRIKQTIKKRPDILLKNIVLDKKGLKVRKYEISTEDIKDIKVSPKSKIVSDKNVKSRKKHLIIEKNSIGIIEIKDIYLNNAYKLKKKKENILGVNNITIMNNTLASNIVKKNVNKKTNILMNRFNEIFEEDDDESSALLLDEAQKLRDMILKNYFNYIDVDFRNITLSKIDIIIRNIRRKIKEKKEYIEVEEKRRSR